MREFQAGPWAVRVAKSHILRSKCEESLEQGCPRDARNKCNVCRFEQDLELPSLPEMVFPESCLRLEHVVSGVVLEFLALDALRPVNAKEDLLKVAAAEEWSRQRVEGLKKVKESVQPFDWTYTTDYKGSLSHQKEEAIEVVETEERIDYEKLRDQEKIAFYDEVILFEDELADHGAAVFSVKIRVMASGFFILSRFFLRVDGVLVRLNDTRIYHQAGSDHLLREFSSKDAKLEELKVSPAVLTDPNKLNNLLPIRQFLVHRINLPSPTSS